MADKKISQGNAFGLNKAERKDAIRRSAPKATIVYEAIRREGEEELARNTSALIWSGLAAGLSMGFSFLMEALLASGLPDSDRQPLISKFGYCIGFLIVVLGRQQLFTEQPRHRTRAGAYSRRRQLRHADKAPRRIASRKCWW